MRYDFLLQHIKENNFKNYLEIGLGGGQTMGFLMKNISDPDFVFYGVDPFVAHNNLHWMGRRFKQEAFDTNRKQVEKLFEDKRGIFYNMFSHDAAKEFEDKSLDIVFVDGNHAYQYVLEDLEDWYPKVKEGGIFCGHDYHARKGMRYHCVALAVNNFTKKINKQVLTAPDYVWWFKK